jgi:hypothetical protein
MLAKKPAVEDVQGPHTVVTLYQILCGECEDIHDLQQTLRRPSQRVFHTEEIQHYAQL